MVWKEYCTEYWLNELQESMDMCTGRRDITEILLKTALNTIQSFILKTVEIKPLQNNKGKWEKYYMYSSYHNDHGKEAFKNNIGKGEKAGNRSDHHGKRSILKTIWERENMLVITKKVLLKTLWEKEKMPVTTTTMEMKPFGGKKVGKIKKKDGNQNDHGKDRLNVILRRFQQYFSNIMAKAHIIYVFSGFYKY